MTTYRKAGDTITVVVAGSAVVADEVAIINGQVGVYQNDAEVGEESEFVISGEHEWPANSAATWAAFDKLYWDSTPGELTDTSAGNVLAGRASTAKGAGETTGRVILSGVADAGDGT